VLNLLSVINVPADQVGVWLGISGGAVLLLLVLSFLFADEWGANRTLLQLAGAGALFFVTLGLTSL
jgi:hypothetical protein